MIINEKCNDCTEPTKYVTGFWDGEKESGFIFACKNLDCDICQLIKTTESEEIQNRINVQEANGKNGMYAGYIALMRKANKISMMKMSQIAGCSPAEYSSYEHERVEFDKEIYLKCENYLKQTIIADEED